MSESFSVALNSSFAELWRYNIAVVVAGFDADGEQLEVKSAQSHIADVGANLKVAPEGYNRHRSLSVVSVPCESVEVLIYIIPHTLPSAKDIADAKPFNIHVTVSRSERSIHDAQHSVNQWSGDSITLKF